VRALVVTVSNRAATGVYADRAGPVLVDGLRVLGFEVDGPLVVPDGEPVAVALRDAVGQAYDVVLTTGGTGLSPTDQTPEMTRRVLDRDVPGLAEAVRAHGVGLGVAAASLSRGLAGVAGTTLIVNLPGSPGGARDGMAVLSQVLRHAVDQIRGGDHARTDHATGEHVRGGHAPGEQAPGGHGHGGHGHGGHGHGGHGCGHHGSEAHAPGEHGPGPDLGSGP
jgi:molybdenum cofactor synthesis domain-containing protein